MSQCHFGIWITQYTETEDGSAENSHQSTVTSFMYEVIRSGLLRPVVPSLGHSRSEKCEYRYCKGQTEVVKTDIPSGGLRKTDISIPDCPLELNRLSAKGSQSSHNHALAFFKSILGLSFLPLYVVRCVIYMLLSIIGDVCLEGLQILLPATNA